MANIVRYLDEPAKSAEEGAKKKAILEHLRSLGPMPCGGSRVERWVMAKAIKLGIQVQVTLGTTEGGFVRRLLNPLPWSGSDCCSILLYRLWPTSRFVFLFFVIAGDGSGLTMSFLYSIFSEMHGATFPSPAKKCSMWP
jgi:hypothetical protein